MNMLRTHDFYLKFSGVTEHVLVGEYATCSSHASKHHGDASLCVFCTISHRAMTAATVEGKDRRSRAAIRGNLTLTMHAHTDAHRIGPELIFFCFTNIMVIWQ